ncbi:MAG: efflux RND transporter periplasmic adaptor subunit [Bacteroidales bacterium]|nr:efflux RND transporter periplasmic adaptor subunit [Bacteroidales bacterium]
MKYFFVYILFSAFIIPGCTRKKPNIITYDLKRSDYLELIDATGTIQAVNNFTLLAPRISVTNLIPVVHLAEEGAHVKKGDTICIFNVPDLLSMVESFNRDLEKMESDMKKLEADNAMQLSLLNAQVETNKAKMAISMLDSIQIKFAPPVKQRLLALEMEKVNIEKKKLQKKFAAQKKIDNSELIQMRSRIMMQKSRLQMFQNQINSLKLVSPVDGIIMHVENYRLEGGTIVFGKIEEGSSTLSNMSVLQIPDMKEMQVSVEVPEADYKRIENGQKVLIRVEAATNLITTGKIKRKTLAGKNTQMQTAIKTYEVIISVDSCHSDMIPGLSASCRIIVDQVKDIIVVPATAIFVRDSTKIVYVAEDYKFIPVTVETGLSNSSKSIVSKGLEGNETIALIEPPHNLIRKEVKSKTDTTANSLVDKKDTVLKNQQ